MPKRRELIGMTAAAALLPGCAATAPLLAGEQTRTFTGVIRKSVEWRYLVWMPEAADRPAGGWPLLIFLHGSGERGTDLEKVKMHGPPMWAARGTAYPLILASPQLEEGARWDPERLHRLQQALQGRLHVDRRRSLATGLSLGGHGVWDWASAYPRDLAAIAPVCGFGDPVSVEAMREVPVRAYHGATDSDVPLARQQACVDALQAAGGRASLTIYPGVGHDSWTPAYQDPDPLPRLLAQRQT